MILMKVKKQRTKPISCDICLIVHGSVLLHAEHQTQADALKPIELAEAARRLLPATSKRQRIALALPSSEFVATTLNLPPAATLDLKNVVNMQLSTLLPGLTEQLLLAVQAPPKGQQTYALWMPVKRAEELFQAFDKVGLFLGCILPRPVLPHTRSVYDEDENNITYLEWSGDVIQHWLQLSKKDFDEPEFQKQLDNALLNFTSDIEVERKTCPSDWEDFSKLSSVAYSYAFRPPSAAARMTEVSRKIKRRSLYVITGLLIVGLVAGIYFAINYKQRLEQRLTDLKRSTFNVSRLRAEVGEIEEKIAPIKNFPSQAVVLILEILNEQIPKDSWITHLHFEENLVKLDGYSPDPTQLMEILNNHPKIFNVEQTGKTSSERGKTEYRFRISFKWKDSDLQADYENYWVEYFSENER